MVELVEVLHVPKDDVLLVDNSSGNLLHAARHLPQVRLQKDTSETVRTWIYSILYIYVSNPVCV